MSTNIFNDAALTVELKKKLTEGMIEAAEPVIQKAMQDVEREMRKRMASMCISYIENSFSMERYGNDLRIVVFQGGKQ